MASKAHEILEKLHGDKGSEFEMDVRSRLSDKSTSSQEQDNESVGTSFTNESETITKTPSQRRASVPKPKREDALKLTGIGGRRKILMFTPEEDKYLKAGLKVSRYSFEKALKFKN